MDKSCDYLALFATCKLYLRLVCLILFYLKNESWNPGWGLVNERGFCAVGKNSILIIGWRFDMAISKTNSTSSHHVVIKSGSPVTLRYFGGSLYNHWAQSGHTWVDIRARPTSKRNGLLIL